MTNHPTNPTLIPGWEQDLEAILAQDSATTGVGAAAIAASKIRSDKISTPAANILIHDSYGIVISELGVLERSMRLYNRAQTPDNFVDMITRWRELEDSMEWYVEQVKEFRF